MYIKLTKVYDGEIGGYPARFVVGDKLDDGSSWEKGFFSNQAELLKQLDDFAVGEEVNVVLERNAKNKKFYNITAFKEMTDADKERVGGSPKYSGGGSSTGGGGKPNSSDKMSKAEWAEKDRVTSLRITKAAAAKLAVFAGKKTPASIIKFAEEMMPWMQDTDSPQDPDIDAGADDPLEPPH